MSSNTPYLSPESLLAAIVDTTEDAIISKDLHSIVMSWNKSAERLFGYSAEEMIGKPITRLFPEDRLDEEALILERIRKGERVEHFETVRVRKDGTPIQVSLTISAIRDQAGIISGASKIARDITEQNRSLRKLADANEELRRADRFKSEFLATLSHELRTPLTAILGWIQLLEDEPEPADLAQGLEVIKRNVRLQTHLIEDLLDMSRIESGKISLDLQRLDLATVVEAAVETVRPTAVSKDIRLTTAYSSVGGIVMADRNRLQQVIWNLLTNGLKFTPKHGRIHVVIERVNSHVEISVSDTGLGIASEFLPHVFDRFRQADSSTTRKHGGLGLGLAISKHLVELHGGTLSAASRGIGHGTRFTVHLPLISAHQYPRHTKVDLRNAEVEMSATPSNLNGIKVLTVDDDADSLHIITKILKKAGAEIKATNSVDEALALYAEFQPDVVLSDIGMPEQDGYELISRLRKLPDGQYVPAVALTALARTEDRTRSLRAGFQMHVAKPVDSDELIAVVQNLASLRRKGA